MKGSGEHNPVLVELHDKTIVITLNRPDRMNALNTALREGLHSALQQVEESDTVCSVVLTGAGPKAFCAGADLAERAGMSDREVKRTVRALQALTSRIANLPVPTIAAINGYAFGGGLEIALACDLRICASEAKMGLPEVQLGIIPGAGGTQRLSRAIGVTRARELIFTGRRIDGNQALTYGIVSESIEREALHARALELAAEINRAAPLALRQAKLAINRGIESDLDTGLAIESAAYDVLIPTEDRVEALAAFREKRKPEFKGR